MACEGLTLIICPDVLTEGNRLQSSQSDRRAALEGGWSEVTAGCPDRLRARKGAAALGGGSGVSL